MADLKARALMHPGTFSDGNLNAIADDLDALNGDLATHATAAVDTDPTLAANSDVLVASQKATKTYADAAKAAVIAIIGAALPTIVISGGVVTDDGSGNGKFNVTACLYLLAGVEYTAPARTGVPATDGHHAYVVPSSNTIVDAASPAAGAFLIADLAVSVGVVTPTAKRPTIATTTF